MKTLFNVLFLCTIIMLSACKKDYEEPAPKYTNADTITLALGEVRIDGIVTTKFKPVLDTITPINGEVDYSIGLMDTNTTYPNHTISLFLDNITGPGMYYEGTSVTYTHQPSGVTYASYVNGEESIQIVNITQHEIIFKFDALLGTTANSSTPRVQGHFKIKKRY